MPIVAPTAAQIPAIRNEYDILAHGNTYGIDYGRITGLVGKPSDEDLLVEAVEARKELVRWSTARPGSPVARRAARAARGALAAYAAAVGLGMRDAGAKVQQLA